MNPEDVPATLVKKVLETRLPSGGLPSLNEPQMRTILAAAWPLIARRVLTEVADKLELVPDYTGTIYDQGRVDQRHMDALVLHKLAGKALTT